MLNILKLKLAVVDVNIFVNPKQNSTHYVSIDFVDCSLPVLDRKIITFYDVYDGNDIIIKLCDDIHHKQKTDFPIVMIEGCLYGYGRKLNISAYNGLLQ